MSIILILFSHSHIRPHTEIHSNSTGGTLELYFIIIRRWINTLLKALLKH